MHYAPPTLHRGSRIVRRPHRIAFSRRMATYLSQAPILTLSIPSSFSAGCVRTVLSSSPKSLALISSWSDRPAFYGLHRRFTNYSCLQPIIRLFWCWRFCACERLDGQTQPRRGVGSVAGGTSLQCCALPRLEHQSRSGVQFYGEPI